MMRFAHRIHVAGLSLPAEKHEHMVLAMEDVWPLSLRIKKCSASAFTRAGRVNDAKLFFPAGRLQSVLQDLAFLLEPGAGAI